MKVKKTTLLTSGSPTSAPEAPQAKARRPAAKKNESNMVFYDVVV